MTRGSRLRALRSDTGSPLLMDHPCHTVTGHPSEPDLTRGRALNQLSGPEAAVSDKRQRPLLFLSAAGLPSPGRDQFSGGLKPVWNAHEMPCHQVRPASPNQPHALIHMPHAASFQSTLLFIISFAARHGRCSARAGSGHNDKTALRNPTRKWRFCAAVGMPLPRIP